MYKKFNELKEGDNIFCIEKNLNKYTFIETKITKIDNSYKDKDCICCYINFSPLSFFFKRDKSSWKDIIFTTKEEALDFSYKSLVNDIDYMKSKIKLFKNIIKKIESNKINWENR